MFLKHRFTLRTNFLFSLFLIGIMQIKYIRCASIFAAEGGECSTIKFGNSIDDFPDIKESENGKLYSYEATIVCETARGMHSKKGFILIFLQILVARVKKNQNIDIKDHFYFKISIKRITRPL